MILFRFVLCLFFFCFLNTPLKSDELHFENGDLIKGQITGMYEGKLMIQTDHAGLVEADWLSIAALSSEDPFYLQVADGDSAYGMMNVGASSSEVQVLTDQGTLEYAKKDIREISKTQTVCPLDDDCEPAPQLSSIWIAKVSGGIKELGGNSDTDCLDGKIKVIRKTCCDGDFLYKWDLTGEFTYKNDTGRVSANKGKFIILHERNLGNNFTIRASEEYRYDKKHDLESRFETKGALGYYVVNCSEFIFQFHLGLSHIDVNYHKHYNSNLNLSDEHDLTYSTGWWFKKHLCGCFYVTHEFEYSPQVGSLSRRWFESDFNIAYPIAEHWEVSLEHEFFYNSRQPVNKKRWDRTVEFKVGYCF
jgi:hypothetical protein